MATNYSLNINETLDKWPGSSPFKMHLKKVFMMARLDETRFFGDAYPAKISGSYGIKMSKDNVSRIRKVLSGRQSPSITTTGNVEWDDISKGLAIYYYNSNNISKKPDITINFIESSLKPKIGGSSAARKPTTEEQEKVTLKIFEELLSVATPKWDKLGYRALRDQVLIKIYPSISSSDPTPAKWNKHFELQFNEIRNVTKLPNNHFDTYDYDQFMDYIVSLVTSQVWNDWGSKISQKDSWNPADIWLVRKSGAEYTKMKNEMNTAVNLTEINDILKVAFNKNIIVGISLKQSDGKKLKYDLINLETTLKDLPEIEYEKMKLNLPFDKQSKEFIKATSEVFVSNNRKTIGALRVGSNASNANSNITYDFKAVPSGSAMLGKIPKDLMLNAVKSLGVSIQDLPTWQQRNEELPKTRTDAISRKWETKIKKIKSKKSLFEFGSYNPDTFITDLIQSLQKHPDVHKNANACIQIMDFAYIICLIHDKKGNKGLNKFWEDMFYYAQKKGRMNKSSFGPFAKLY